MESYCWKQLSPCGKAENMVKAELQGRQKSKNYTFVILRAAEKQAQAQRAEGRCVQHSLLLLAEILRLLSSAPSLNKGIILSCAVTL